MYNKIILSLVCLFGSLALQAQSSISGKITDDKNQALPYATVRLLQPDSTFVMGAASDSMGVYVFKNVATGSYIIAASSIGYENAMLTVDIKKGYTTENPFTRHSYHKENSNYTVYQYNKRYNSRLDQQTGYVKLSYTVDFGKKVSRESGNVNKTINSAILKAE